MDGGDALLDFYSGRGRDHRGRSLSDIRRFSIAQLEQSHDFIQWLFPLREASAFNPFAPTLTDAAIDEFRRQPQLRRELRRSLTTMAGFYGFDVQEIDGAMTLTTAADFDARAADWITPGNHNFLRITRILKSLCTLGEAAAAAAFLETLERACADYADVIGHRTWHYWHNAMHS